jgi:hypothetical protein
MRSYLKRVGPEFNVRVRSRDGRGHTEMDRRRLYPDRDSSAASS